MKISIVMPLYNDAATVRRALDSAVSQGADEVVVVDDCSTDGSYEIACEYPVRVIRHPAKSEDHVRAIEPIIDSLEADYVLGLGADDWLYEGCIAAIRAGHDFAPQSPGVIFCDFDHVGEGDPPRHIRTLRYSPVMTYLSPEHYRQYIGPEVRRPDCGVGSAIRRDILIWLQREEYASLGPVADVWGWMLAGIMAGAVYVPGPFAAFTALSAEPTYSRRKRDRKEAQEAGIAFLSRPAVEPFVRGVKWNI